ncbi:MAG: formylglycine-generating enzyme family protein [Thermoguttaceae bacterium]
MNRHACSHGHGAGVLNYGLLPTAVVMVLMTASISRAEGNAADVVDYRYFALDSWVGAIGLPDDCFKSAVDADGRFLTEFGHSGPHQGIYPNPPAQSKVAIHADLLGRTTRIGQQMYSPRVPIAVTRKRQRDIMVTEQLFLARPLTWSAGVQGAALRGRDSRPDARQYLLMVEYANAGPQPAEVQPVLHVEGAAPVAKLDVSPAAFSVAPNTQCQVSCGIESFQPAAARNATLTLKKIKIEPGKKANWVLAIDRNGFPGAGPVSWAEAASLREKCVVYWEKTAGLPYDVICVPDAEIQALLDTSIRELYQMRYVIRGLPAYFFGPGVYNDYWILDGSFVTEAMDMLGRSEDAAGYADYLLLHQQKDGRIQCMNEHWKETGIALVTLQRHARLTQDKPWLLARWPQVRRAVGAIRQLRRTGTSVEPKALNFGLGPVGFGDGGIGREAEYTNNYWLLGGLKAAVEAAVWLGKSDDAKQWSREYEDFQRVFQAAIRRDAKTDPRSGARYIPVIMGERAPQFPARGQWAFCQGIYPCRIFTASDPLMRGTLAMLTACEVQGGIVENSGWIGIWAQCGSFYGHDWLWLGDGRKAARLLYAFANHASPLRNWREEMPKLSRPGERFPYGRGGGDMPHVSAAAEFVRLAGHLLAFDRGDELHLFEGIPPTWLRPGATTRLNGLATPFGRLTLKLQVAADGKTASLAVAPVDASSCRKIVVHLGPSVRELDPSRAHELTLTAFAATASAHDEGGADDGMVLVSAGPFTMGSPGTALDEDAAERPVHQVNLPAFYIDKCEVTTAQFAAFLNAVQRTRDEAGREYVGIDEHLPLERAGGQWRAKKSMERFPMGNVTWYGATAYARWAGKRLPTEAEWEKAARGTDGRKFPWGNTLDFSRFRLGIDRLAPVGSPAKDESPYGCANMADNVWEWTSSRFQPYPYNPTDGREDPQAAGRRVARGGSFSGEPEIAHAAYRFHPEPDFRHYYVGFRCARSAP